jgi:hypothetical protein
MPTVTAETTFAAQLCSIRCQMYSSTYRVVKHPTRAISGTHAYLTRRTEAALRDKNVSIGGQVKHT